MRGNRGSENNSQGNLRGVSEQLESQAEISLRLIDLAGTHIVAQQSPCV